MPTICLASDYLERSFFFDMWLKATVFSRSFTGMKIKGRYHSKTHRPKNRTGSATVTTDLSARTTLLQWHKTEHIIQLTPSIYSDCGKNIWVTLCVTVRYIKASITATLKHYVQLMQVWENAVVRFLLSLLSSTGWIHFFFLWYSI